MVAAGAPRRVSMMGEWPRFVTLCDSYCCRFFVPPQRPDLRTIARRVLFYFINPSAGAPRSSSADARLSTPRYRRMDRDALGRQFGALFWLHRVLVRRPATLSSNELAAHRFSNPDTIFHSIRKMVDSLCVCACAWDISTMQSSHLP